MPERTAARYHDGEVVMPCPDDADIVAFAHGGLAPQRRAALRDHVDACPECGGLVAEAVRAIDPVDTAMDGSMAEHEPVAEPPEPVPELGHGSAVGRYLLLHLIGAGGLGQVWAAYDPELDRRVAVKLIRPQVRARVQADELRARLVREAQSLARVRDPQVVAVHDAGRFGDQVFIAMELVDGPTLDAWLRQAPRSWAAIRDAFVQAGRGLAAVHAAGLVHRDFKPTNVLVDRDGRVRVADFGLAREEHGGGASGREGASHSGAAPEASVITASGLVVGTPPYMAPEQHAGGSVDARADQFAFCVALFQALYGHRPFAGSSAQEVREAILAGRIEGPAQPDAAPAWLHRAILRGISREPSDRYASMTALLDAISRDRLLRRRRGLGLAVALGLCGLAVGAWLRAPTTAAATTESTRVQALVDAAHRAAARAHFVYPPPEDPSSRTAFVEVLALEALDGDEAEAGSHAAAELRDELATTLVRLGDAYWDRDGGRIFALDYYAIALVFDPSRARALERSALTSAQRAALVTRAASLSFDAGELWAAAPLAALAQDDEPERARAIDRLRATEALPATTTAALDRLAPKSSESAIAARPTRVEAPAPAEEEPVDPGTHARADRRARPPSIATPDRPTPAEASDASAPSAPADPASAARDAERGLAALARGDLDAAEIAFHSALRSDRRNADALAGLGEVAFQRRAYKAAARYLERAVAVAPARAKLHVELGDVYYKVLRYEDALSAYEEAIARGSTTAAEKLERLRRKLGEESAP
jgi:tetratricopeptide (TPR) repeat protein